MSIRKATTKDAEDIRALILRAVEPESNVDFDKEGIQNFYIPNELPAIRSRILSKEYLMLCFMKDELIAGLITIHANEKLDQLFVDPSSRGMKISSQLWEAAKSICLARGNTGNFWVKSSTLAVPVYDSFGFCLAGTRQKNGGIVYYPMVLEFEGES